MYGIGRRSLAQLIADAPQREVTARVRALGAQPGYMDEVGTFDLPRGDNVLRVIDHPGRRRERGCQRVDVRVALRLEPNRF